eukprot:symbB.v1.2.037044.t2/scaffold5366.1/size32324/2
MGAEMNWPKLLLEEEELLRFNDASHWQVVDNALQRALQSLPNVLSIQVLHISESLPMALLLPSMNSVKSAVAGVSTKAEKEVMESLLKHSGSADEVHLLLASPQQVIQAALPAPYPPRKDGPSGEALPAVVLLCEDIIGASGALRSEDLALLWRTYGGTLDGRELRVVPEASEQMSLMLDEWPLSAKLCVLSTFGQVFACWSSQVSLQSTYNDLTDLSDEEDTKWLARSVLVISVSSVVIGRILEWWSRMARRLVIPRGCMQGIYINLTYYVLLYKYPIYLPRWMVWVATTAWIFTNVYPVLMDQHTVLDTLVRIFPLQAASASFCWARFLTLRFPQTGQILEVLAWVTCGCMILDALAVFHGRMANKEVHSKFSLGMKECIWIANLCTYLCGLWGLASWYSGQGYPGYAVSELILHISIPMCFFFWCLQAISMQLALIESFELERRTRVVECPSGIDVSGVNALSVAEFLSLEESLLKPRWLSSEVEALKLPLNSSLQTALAALSATGKDGQPLLRVRLTATSSGKAGLMRSLQWFMSLQWLKTHQVHGLVMRCHWAHEGQAILDPKKLDQRLAGIIWPVDRGNHPPDLLVGDAVVVTIRYSPARGIVARPVTFGLWNSVVMIHAGSSRPISLMDVSQSLAKLPPGCQC